MPSGADVSHSLVASHSLVICIIHTAVDLPLFTPGSKIFTPDSEEGGVTTLFFTTLVKGLK